MEKASRRLRASPAGPAIVGSPRCVQGTSASARPTPAQKLPGLASLGLRHVGGLQAWGPCPCSLSSFRGTRVSFGPAGEGVFLPVRWDVVNNASWSWYFVSTCWGQPLFQGLSGQAGLDSKARVPVVIRVVGPGDSLDSATYQQVTYFLQASVSLSIKWE